MLRDLPLRFGHRQVLNFARNCIEQRLRNHALKFFEQGCLIFAILPTDVEQITTDMLTFYCLPSFGRTMWRSNSATSRFGNSARTSGVNICQTTRAYCRLPPPAKLASIWSMFFCLAVGIIAPLLYQLGLSLNPSLTAGLKDTCLFNRLCFAIMPLWRYTVGLNGVDLKNRFLCLSWPVGNPEGIIDDLLAWLGPAGFAHMDRFAVLAFELDGDADLVRQGLAQAFPAQMNPAGLELKAKGVRQMISEHRDKEMRASALGVVEKNGS